MVDKGKTASPANLQEYKGSLSQFLAVGKTQCHSEV